MIENASGELLIAIVICDIRCSHFFAFALQSLKCLARSLIFCCCSRVTRLTRLPFSLAARHSSPLPCVKPYFDIKRLKYPFLSITVLAANHTLAVRHRPPFTVPCPFLLTWTSSNIRCARLQITLQWLGMRSIAMLFGRSDGEPVLFGVLAITYINSVSCILFIYILLNTSAVHMYCS
jgi:hypothetical protein